METMGLLGEQSAQMVERMRFGVLRAGTNVVYANGRFELAYVYNFGGIRDTVENGFKNGVTEISGRIAGVRKLVKRGIDDTLKALGL